MSEYNFVLLKLSAKSNDNGRVQVS